MQFLNSLVSALAAEITASEKRIRKRKRSKPQQNAFERAVLKLTSDMWKASYMGSNAPCLISLNSNSYSGSSRYVDQSLNYRPTRAAFDGLKRLGYIDIVQNGFLNRQTGVGQLTRYRPTKTLRKKLDAIDGHPAKLASLAPQEETILLRGPESDGRKDLIEYTDTPQTDEWRANLETINSVLSRHWADLEIKDSDFSRLQTRLVGTADREPINFFARTLVRIFTNGSFEEGGRFYRGWWQNVPSEYRPFITIDAKRTVEYDYSAMNPHMAYAMKKADPGPSDLYERVIDRPITSEKRDVIKQAFNAMLQMKTELPVAPKGIDPSLLGMTWKELRNAIVKAHKPIADLFFTGIGNKLQFEDSCIAESIMLHFAAMDAPVLPIHDSFIMHHGYGSELEEQMRKSFHARFGTEIRTKSIIAEREAPNDPDYDNSLENVLNYAPYVNWSERQDSWFANR